MLWPVVNPAQLVGWFSYAAAATAIVVLIAIVLGVGATAVHDRARTAWMLLPIPLALALSLTMSAQANTEPSWANYMLVVAFGNASIVAGAAAVTYALLKRRVLDFQFVVSRALVVAGVSAVVVVSFVLLEWALSTFLTRASHATGVAANAALALVLGLSMTLIHKRVDALVDFVFFYKRREDERALRDFAREAAFATCSDELLDVTVQNIRAHTDARSAAVFVEQGSEYRSVRHFGDAPDAVGANDPAILALKASHAPVDPHRYATAFRGELALPMLARGRLVGVVLCGPRATGEGYAPDEVAALREVAQAVGLALDALGSERSSTEERLMHVQEQMLAELQRIAAALAGG